MGGRWVEGRMWVEEDGRWNSTSKPRQHILVQHCSTIMVWGILSHLQKKEGRRTQVREKAPASPGLVV